MIKYILLLTLVVLSVQGFRIPKKNDYHKLALEHEYFNTFKNETTRQMFPHISDQRDFYQKLFDTNKDGKVTIKQWYEGLQILHYEKGVTLKSVQPSFDFFDKNRDGIVSYREFVDGSSPHLLKYEDPEYLLAKLDSPKEIHLALTNYTSEMQVMWVIRKQKNQTNPIVQYGRDEKNLNMTVKGSYHTYDLGIGGFHGLIYVGYMKNLESNTQYYYRVGDFKTQIFSDVIPFKAAPKKGEVLPLLDIVMFGDQGTKVPFSGPVNDMIIRDNEKNHYNMTVLVGDVSYAGISGVEKGSYQVIWDWYGNQNQPWAEKIPFIPGVGNHEQYYNFTPFHERYIDPKSEGSNRNFWFSFDYGQVHFTMISTEQDFHEGTPQRAWIEMDLKKASLDPKVKWIVVGGHRPFYCSLDDQLSTHIPGARRITQLQGVFKKYKVDFILNGHQHCYERIHPNYDGKVEMTGNVYRNPKNPVYIVQGNAGALIDQKWTKEQPEWSAHRETKYGYGRFQALANNTIHYQNIRYPGNVTDEFWLIKDD